MSGPWPKVVDAEAMLDSFCNHYTVKIESGKNQQWMLNLVGDLDEKYYICMVLNCLPIYILLIAKEKKELVLEKLDNTSTG